MHAPFHVRRLRPEELDGILKVEQASFGKDAYDRNLFANYLQRDGELFLVVERGKEICGYSIAVVRGDRAELVSIAVDPKSRRKGVGRALLASTLRRLSRRGVTRVSLTVRPENEPARALYESYGFVKWRKVPGYYEDGTDGVRMRRLNR